MDILGGFGDPSVQFYSWVIVALMISIVVAAMVLARVLPTEEPSTVPRESHAS